MALNGLRSYGLWPASLYATVAVLKVLHLPLTLTACHFSDLGNSIRIFLLHSPGMTRTQASVFIATAQLKEKPQ